MCFIIKAKWSSFKTKHADLSFEEWSKGGAISVTTIGGGDTGWGYGDHFIEIGVQEMQVVT